MTISKLKQLAKISSKNLEKEESIDSEIDESDSPIPYMESTAKKVNSIVRKYPNAVTLWSALEGENDACFEGFTVDGLEAMFPMANVDKNVEILVRHNLVSIFKDANTGQYNIC